MGYFSGGNETTGTPATIVEAWFLNTIQEELCNVITAAGIVLDKEDNSQLLAALTAITGGNIYLPLAGGTMTGMIGWAGMTNGPPDPDDLVSGIRLSLFEPGVGGCDYGIGIESAGVWFGTNQATDHFSFYGGTQLNARIAPNGTPVQDYDLVNIAYLEANARTMLTANRTYHIAPTGSDTTGDGSAANPWQTLQYAWDWVNAYIDFGGYTVTISMAAGTYTSGLSASGTCPGSTASGPFIISGVAADNTQVQIHTNGEDGIDAEHGASLYVQHVTITSITSGGAGGIGMGASYGGEILFRDVNFANCSANQLLAAAGGSIIAMGDYYISGNSVDHAQATQGGYIELSSYPDRHVAVTLQATPNFTGGFVVAGGGQISAGNNTFPGSGATGPKFDAHLNGVIFTYNKSVNYFPGSVAGSTSTGGQYG
jgi:hypothetical protein